ncbi:MAG: hypothetical protein GTO24_00845 [candidate division Zixibacteria bacterium]|nr:hypothetical protein [candidate division Zixibacteria bacterium]
MEKEGLIQKVKDRHGCYRCLEKECEEIDWLNAPDKTIDLKWPFGIERYVRILPRNTICIAGEPDSGKTAVILNFIKLNMGSHDIHFFSSEMGPIELRDRLKHFDIPREEWCFHAKERSSNFGDVILPDAVNCIDYLEMHDEFYKVGGHIKEIYDRLKTGVAIIALQKNRGTPYGLGGMRGLEKPRLYLSMEPGKIRIIKAKNWVDFKRNPNGLELDFKLIKGCEFIAETDWHKGEG